MRCISLKTILYGRLSCDYLGGEVASIKTYLGGRSSIPLKTTLWSAFTYAVRLLCLREIVPLKSYLGDRGSGAAGAVFSHTGIGRGAAVVFVCSCVFSLIGTFAPGNIGTFLWHGRNFRFWYFAQEIFAPNCHGSDRWNQRLTVLALILHCSSIMWSRFMLRYACKCGAVLLVPK